ncbi:MAG: signal peptide peptidase SppA [Chloroflexota bacterium]|nr:signal peptide peptidase SppA [Chloroflexota bacterium]
MKKAIIVIVALSLIVVVGLGLLVTIQVDTSDKVAVIPLSGEIASDSQDGLLFGGETITPDLVRDYLSRAEDDSTVKAVVLRISSNGGTSLASQDIARIVKEFKEETGKPVVVSMGQSAASGGYYISVYATSILAEPSTTTGSIGVRMDILDTDGLLEKIGVERKTVISQQTPYKDILAQYDAGILQVLCDETYVQFASAVAEGRQGKLTADIGEIADGRVYSGMQAKELGLVDEIGNLEDSIDLAIYIAGLDEAKVQWYGKSSSLYDRLFGVVAKVDSYLSDKPSDEELILMRAMESEGIVLRY